MSEKQAIFRFPLSRLLRLSPPTDAGKSLPMQLVQGVLGTGGLKISGKLLSLVSSVLLARLLSAEGYGIYGFAMASVGLLAIPVSLGFPKFIVRQCAVYLGRNDLSSMKGLLHRANYIVLVAALVIGAGAAFSIGRWIPSVGAVEPRVLLYAIALLPLIALNGIRGATLRGLGRVTLGQFPELLLRPLLFITCIGTIAATRQHLEPTQAILANATAMLVAFIAGAWLLRASLPSDYANTAPRFCDRQWLVGVLPFLALGATHLITQQTDILMLGILATAEDVGIYRVASQLAMLVVFGLMIVNPVIAPHLARLHDLKDHANLQRVVTLAAQGSLVLAVPFAFAFLVAGGWILPTVFGDAFAAGERALRVLTVAQLFSASMGSVAMILNMTGHAWYGTVGVFIAGVLNVGLNILLVPLYGVEGAAFATALSLVTWNFLLACWVYRLTGLVSIPIHLKSGQT